MDATRFLKRMNQKGIAIIYLAILLVALIGISALVIDFGYRHMVKAQLQNAADSAALAGASKLKSTITGYDPNDPVQTAARTEAKSFASSNKAASIPVVIDDDTSNDLKVNNDITVGHWNQILGKYSASGKPVNAIQVRTRRTQGSPKGPINTFLGTIFGSQFSTLDVKAEAIAATPVRPGSYIAICIDSCTNAYAAPVTGQFIFETGKDTSGTTFDNVSSNRMFAWTTLLDNPTSSNSVGDMICKAPGNFTNVCTKSIYSSMGTQTASLRNLEFIMYNPQVGRDSKDPPSGNSITGWTLIVPVTESCPPGQQGNAWDPKKVSDYAKIHIAAICSAGEGNPCAAYYSGPDYSSDSNFCKDFKKDHDIKGSDFIIVDSIQCIKCGSDNSFFPGQKQILVK